MTGAPASAVASIFALLGTGEYAAYIGEPISQLAHALQAAALAEAAAAPTPEIIAALLHDVGHLCAPPESERMDAFGVTAHEDVGAAWLASLGVAPEVCALVAGHVAAKRYLVATRPGYTARLSPASQETLTRQGGPMTAAEVAAFEADPLRDALLRVRSWDEAAKVPGRVVPPLSHYRERLTVLIRFA